MSAKTKKYKRIKKKRTGTGRHFKARRRTAAPLCLSIVALIIIAINLVIIRTSAPLIVSAGEASVFAGEDGVDCILVLGASVTEHGPSPMLADRLDTGLELFGLGVSDIMLFSGDNGTIEYNEVQTMKNYALENGESVGLEAANIYLDYAGFSTYNSAVRCKEIFQAKRVVIVTQRYHLYRALYNAKLVGLDAIGVAAKDTKYGQLTRDLREIPARLKDFILTHTGYTPKIMGDPVPLVYPSTQG